MPATATVVQDLVEVSDSWVQGNAANFAFSQCPTGTMPDKRTGVRSLIYRIASLANYMSAGGKKILHENGDALPEIKALLEVLVSVEATGGITTGKRVDISADTASRWRNLVRDIVPGLMGQAYQQLESSLADNLTDATIWGTSKTLSGTGTLKVATDSTLDVDLTDHAEPLLKYSAREGFSLEMWVDRTLLNIMRRHVDFTGAGIGSNSAMKLPVDEFASRLFDSTGIERVVQFGHGVKNTARAGQTVALQEIGYGVCWIGVVDRRGDWDLGDAGGMKPDGALQLALPRMPEIVIETPQSQIEDLYCQYTSRFFNPRPALGIFIEEAEFRS